MSSTNNGHEHDSASESLNAPSRAHFQIFDKRHSFLVPTDFSPSSNGALSYALSLAQQLGGKIILLHVVEKPSKDALIGYTDVDSYLIHQEHKGMSLLRKWGENAKKHEVNVETFIRTSNHVDATIIGWANRQSIAMTLMGTRVHLGGSIGKNARAVTQFSRHPVLTVPPGNKWVAGFLKNILVPMDLPATNPQALFIARELAALQGAKIKLLHVLESPLRMYSKGKTIDLLRAETTKEQKYRELEAYTSGILGDISNCSFSIMEGEPGQQIVDYAEKEGIQLIVQGARGLTDIDHLTLGHVAEKVIGSASCPVITVKNSSSANVHE